MRTFALILALLAELSVSKCQVTAPPPVNAVDSEFSITLDNSIVAIDIGKSKSQVESIRYRHNGQITEMSKTMYSSAGAGSTDRASSQPPSGSIQITSA